MCVGVRSRGVCRVVLLLEEGAIVRFFFSCSCAARLNCVDTICWDVARWQHVARRGHEARCDRQFFIYAGVRGQNEWHQRPQAWRIYIGRQQ